VIVRFNHYKDSFPTLDGALKAADIAERYSFSFAYKGNYKLHLYRFADNASMTNRRNHGPVHLDDEFLDCVDGVEYRVEIEEDEEEVKREELERAQRRPVQIISMEQAAAQARGDGSGLRGKANAVDAITHELKQMSTDELREKGDKYKQLLEARDLEDILFSR
jgi:hypothetical protein